MKKLTAILFAMLLMLSLPITAFAAEEELVMPDVKNHLPYYYTLLSKEDQADYLKLRKAVMNHEKRVQFTATEVTSSFLATAVQIMSENDTYTFDLDSVNTRSTGYRTNGVFRASKYELIFEYKMSKANYMRAIAYTDKKVKKFIETLPEDANTTTKLIKAHDFVADSCVYDLEYKNGYTAYAALVYGRALCEGYAKAFEYICEELGIPCVVAVGDSVDSDVGHAWNKVKVGKNWYNVDVTNDDLDDGFYGVNSKNYFFLADSEYKIAKEIFYDEIEEPLATDTEHSYYEMTNQTFATSKEAIEYMNTKLAGGIPIIITVGLENSAEYKKFGDSFFDAAAASPTVKKLKEIHVNSVHFDDTYVYILYFH
jgi:hypothetical protein